MYQLLRQNTKITLVCRKTKKLFKFYYCNDPTKSLKESEFLTVIVVYPNHQSIVLAKI